MFLEYIRGLENLPSVYAPYFLTTLYSLFSNQLNIGINCFWLLYQKKKQILLTLIHVNDPLILVSVIKYVLLINVHTRMLPDRENN